MESLSKKGKDRDLMQMLISFFPQINREGLCEVLNQSSNDEISSFSLSDSMTDDKYQINISDKNLINLSEAASQNNESNQIYSSKIDEKKEDKYRRAVRKSVTTQTLPSIPNLSNIIEHAFKKPDFLKKTLKSILERQRATTIFTKLSLNSFSKTDTLFALNVAGTTDTDYALEIATKRFAHINDSQKFIFSYIFPTSEEDKSNNYRNKKDVVMTTFHNNMRNLDVDRFFFIGEERSTKAYQHAIQQVEKISVKYGVNYLLCGYTSLKGPKGDNKVLEKGLLIMLRSGHRTPFILVKESCFQKPESSLEGLNWLFIFDKQNAKCFDSFKKFAPLIDFSRDKVCGFTLIHTSNTVDDIEPLFMKEITSRQVTKSKFKYESERYNDDPHIFVNKKVNFDNTPYDFVVIYNNSSYNEFTKFAVEKQMISNMHIILGASSNICVMNSI